MTFVAFNHRPAFAPQRYLARFVAADKPGIEPADYFPVGCDSAVLFTTANNRIEVFPVGSPEHLLCLETEHKHLAIRRDVTFCDQVIQYPVKDLGLY